MKTKSSLLIITVFLVSLLAVSASALPTTTTHEGHFAVDVGDKYEFVWKTLKDADGNNVTDWQYPDAPDSHIAQGDHFYIEITTINASMMGPSCYGKFTFADGAATEEQMLVGYFKPMNSSEYNWTYWESYYESKNYTVTKTDEYFEYATSNDSADPNLMRFRWDITDGAMLEWELHGFWIQMMGFGTLSEIFIQRYESATDYGVKVGDKIWLKFDILKDSDGNPITDGSYEYPEAPNSSISQGDVCYIEITTINSSFMGTVVYGKWVFGDVVSPETMLMGYVKSREWDHYQLYYASKGYTVINNATHFGYQSGTVESNLLKMVWNRTTGIVADFHLTGMWVNMMGFGTLSEIRLVITTEPTAAPESSPGFESFFILLALLGIAAIQKRRN